MWFWSNNLKKHQAGVQVVFLTRVITYSGNISEVHRDTKILLHQDDFFWNQTPWRSSLFVINLNKQNKHRMLYKFDYDILGLQALPLFLHAIAHALCSHKTIMTPQSLPSRFDQHYLINVDGRIMAFCKTLIVQETYLTSREILELNVRFAISKWSFKSGGNTWVEYSPSRSWLTIRSWSQAFILMKI